MINNSGITMQAYFIIVFGSIMLVAVMQIPVGGAAAGVQMAKWEQTNSKHISPIVFIPIIKAKLYSTGMTKTTTIKLVAMFVKIAANNKAITINTTGESFVKGVNNDISVAEIPVSGVFIKLEITIINATIKIGSQPIFEEALLKSKNGVPSSPFSSIITHRIKAIVPNIPNLLKKAAIGPKALMEEITIKTI